MMSRAYKTARRGLPTLPAMNDPTRFHLAQVNVAQLKAPLDSPQLAGFVARLDEINTLADGSDGFVWRLQTDAGDATALRVFDDDRVLVNLSVWTSVKALHDYVYRSRHAELIRARKPWFEPLGRAHYALWWIPAGTLPTVAEAVQRLALLQASGPTPAAFDFQRLFGAGEAERPANAAAVLSAVAPAP
jgi:hypothetical protein